MNNQQTLEEMNKPIYYTIHGSMRSVKRDGKWVGHIGQIKELEGIVTPADIKWCGELWVFLDENLNIKYAAPNEETIKKMIEMEED